MQFIIRILWIRIAVLGLFVVTGLTAVGQKAPMQMTNAPVGMGQASMENSSAMERSGNMGSAAVTESAPTPLSQLLAEANARNSQISAAQHRVQAAKMVQRQMTTLPDPTFTYQNLSVGSPKPFAGYTNSDFAYIGIGASQTLPYPGKLRLRGEVAERDAEVMGRESDVIATTVAGQVKEDYVQLAYMQQTLAILEENLQTLQPLIENAASHYAVGQGAQVDILQAQVERTKMLREITMHHQQVAQMEAHLKGLLHREQNTPDIVTETLVQSPMPRNSAELLEMVRARNPQVQVDASTIRKQDAAVASAKREGRPDFELAYIYENTDRKYRDYYMFTLNVTVPRRKRIHAEMEEAKEKLAESQATMDAQVQEQMAAVQREYVTATGDEALLKEYDGGLIPLSDAAYHSTLNSYGENRDPFSQVLMSFLNVLQLKLDAMQVLAEHETALVHLETLTGATLR